MIFLPTVAFRNLEFRCKGPLIYQISLCERKRLVGLVRLKNRLAGRFFLIGQNKFKDVQRMKSGTKGKWFDSSRDHLSNYWINSFKMVSNYLKKYRCNLDSLVVVAPTSQNSLGIATFTLSLHLDNIVEDSSYLNIF